MRIASDKNKAPKQIQKDIRDRVLLLKGVVDSINKYKPIFTKEEILKTLIQSGFVDPIEYSLTEISIISDTSITTLWRIQESAMESLKDEHLQILEKVSDYVDI